MPDHRVGVRPIRPLTRFGRGGRVRRGAAMVEALIALPVFLAVAIALPWLHALYAGKQRAGLEARSCAFAHAYAGCREPPPHCASTLAAAGSPDAESANSIETQARALVPLPGFDVFEWVPALGEAVRGLLGEKTRARAQFEVRGLGTGEEPRRVAADFVLLCNERPRDVLALARGVLCDHLPVLHCGG
jgi:hypothetical protein